MHMVKREQPLGIAYDSSFMTGWSWLNCGRFIQISGCQDLGGGERLVPEAEGVFGSEANSV